MRQTNAIGLWGCQVCFTFTNYWVGLLPRFEFLALHIITRASTVYVYQSGFTQARLYNIMYIVLFCCLIYQSESEGVVYAASVYIHVHVCLVELS